MKRYINRCALKKCPGISQKTTDLSFKPRDMIPRRSQRALRYENSLLYPVIWKIVVTGSDPKLSTRFSWGLSARVSVHILQCPPRVTQYFGRKLITKHRKPKKRSIIDGIQWGERNFASDSTSRDVRDCESQIVPPVSDSFKMEAKVEFQEESLQKN